MNVSWAPFQDILCTCQLCSVTIQQKQHMSPVVISLTCLGFFFIRKIWAQMGGQDKPSLSAWPSPVVPQGQHVTLPCRSHHKFDTFRLYKDNGILISKLHGAISQKGFLVGPVTPTHAGTYRCCGSYPGSSSVWSAPSDPLVIVVTGLHQKPSLGAQPGAVVRSGENVTFSCCSESSFDVYHLSRDEQPRGRWLAKGQRRGGESQADFPLGPAHSALGGTYRCHGSFNRSPCEWSGPSDPLYLSITGNSSTSCLPSTKPTCETGNPRHLHVLAGPLVAIVFLAVLLFFLTRRWCPAKENVATMNREPEVDRMLSRGLGRPRLTLFSVISSPPSPHKCVHTLLTISHHAGPSGRRPTGGDIHTVGSLHFHAEKTTPTSQRPEESLRDDGVYEELATC